MNPSEAMAMNEQALPSTDAPVVPPILRIIHVDRTPGIFNNDWILTATDDPPSTDSTPSGPPFAQPLYYATISCCRPMAPSIELHQGGHKSGPMIASAKSYTFSSRVTITAGPATKTADLERASKWGRDLFRIEWPVDEQIQLPAWAAGGKEQSEASGMAMTGQKRAFRWSTTTEERFVGKGWWKKLSVKGMACTDEATGELLMVFLKSTKALSVRRRFLVFGASEMFGSEVEAVMILGQLVLLKKAEMRQRAASSAAAAGG